ncbi:MAG: chromate transporter [Olsenella sp.]|nr:chromate transporter [Olsenella sp.]
MSEVRLLLAVFLAFVRVGALAFGGAYAAIPLVEQEVVVRSGWMTYAEFMDLLALDEITPGPILINSATFVGMKVAGIPGAIAATLGCIVVPCAVAMTLLLIFRKYKDTPVVKTIVLSLKCMALALIASTMVKLGVQAVAPDAPSLDVVYGAYVALVMCGAFYLINQRHLKPLYVMLGCGVVNLVAHLLVF